MIECDIPHYPDAVDSRNCFYVYDEMICINGVCYYFGTLHSDEDVLVIVCFDIRSEKFKYIRIAQDMRHIVLTEVEATLVNYKDKLAKLQLNIVGGICTGIRLWVMEHAEKHEWSSYIYVMPPPWKNIVEKTKLRLVGRNTSTGEIVLSPNEISDSFYLFYYNPERNTITRVEIQGLEAFKHCKVYTFLDHVEDVKLMINT